MEEINSPQMDEASSQVTEDVQPSTPEADGNITEQQLVELDKLDKFKFQGKEWNTKDLLSGFMRQSDYTHKTTEMAKDRKYYDHLSADLENVRNRPELAAQFKQLYPEKFHSYLRLLQQEQMSEPDKESAQSLSLPPEVKKLVERFDVIEGHYKEQQVKSTQAQLDAIIDPLNKKYPFADEEAALARGQMLHDKGVELTQERWEEIYKTIHSRNESAWKANKSEQIKKQKEANLKGSDAPSGGGIPGGKPYTPKTVKEAHKMYLEDLNGQQG